MANPFAAHPGSPISVAPSFAWSSNAGSFATTQSSRAVTPDTSLSSIAALPARPMQPPAQSALQNTASSNPWASPPQSGNSGLTATSNPWASPPQQAQSFGMTNGAWGRPTLPQTSNSMSNIASLNTLKSFSTAPSTSMQISVQSNAFVLAPPPGSNVGLGASTSQVPFQKKSTSDNSDSLI